MKQAKIDLTITKRTDERLLQRMAIHYSKPKGFVGRNICYAVSYEGVYYGHIVGGSATRFLPGRDEYLDVADEFDLVSIVNNLFFNVSHAGNGYPLRNFTTQCVKTFTERVQEDWKAKYGDTVTGLETLIEKPRIGELYRKAGWVEVGETAGYSCKRVGGIGTDDWTGARVWITDPLLLKPKIVLCKKV